MRASARAIALGLVLLVAAFTLWQYMRTRASFPPPPPTAVATQAGVSRAEFVGAERCAGCHTAEYARWQRSTHGRAGGDPSPQLVIARFDGAAIRFTNATVTPRARGSTYEFVVERTREPAQVFRVQGVLGGGHIYGGGTQGFLIRHDDGTLRLLPFEWSRQAGAWFCNTNSRSGKGWSPITPNMRIEECGDWPPTRVLGDNARFANCQSCHASQASLGIDSAGARYATRLTSLAINCESCHGPARRHVELAERGAFASTADLGLASLAVLDKDASLQVCYQCHAVKDQLRDGFLSGDSLSAYYSLEFPLLGDRPLFADGRVRTFAYQEGHQFSDCYLHGGLTCTSCHDPHGQSYRDVWGTPLPGRFDDRQCTSCHASKAEHSAEHTHHRPESTRCTSCHMPHRQEPETRATSTRIRTSPVVLYARSDHTISIPRPALDASLGLVSACGACHAKMTATEQERRIRAWWGNVKPIDPIVAAQLSAASAASTAEADTLLLANPNALADSGHAFARFAGVARFLETRVRPDVPFDRDIEARLRRLASSNEEDLRALALATLHLADGGSPSTRRILARALRSAAPLDAGLRARWALALGYMGDRYAADGDLAGAATAYARALEVRPDDARLLLSLANNQRDRGDMSVALESYRRALSKDQRNPLIWVNYGIALAAAGDTTNAMTALRNATALNEYEPLAWFNLANLYFVRGDLARAKPLYERTAQLDPSIALAHFQLARVSLLQHDERAALVSLRRGLAFDSSDASARAMAEQLERRVFSEPRGR